MKGHMMRKMLLVVTLVMVCWPASVRAQANNTDKAQRPSHRKGPAALKAQLKIAPDVYQRLEKSRDGRVYVMVTLKPLPREARSDEQRKAAARRSQDELVAKIAPGEFEVGYRHERDPILFGHVNAAGLATVAGHPNVESIQFKIEAGVHQELETSTDGKALVYVALTRVPWKGRTLDHRMFSVKQIQDRVLRGLDEQEFTIKWRYDLFASVSGWGNGRALEKLALDPDVITIGVVGQVSLIP